LERQALISRWLSLVGALVLAVFVASGTVALNGALRAQNLWLPRPPGLATC